MKKTAKLLKAAFIPAIILSMASCSVTAPEPTPDGDDINETESESIYEGYNLVWSDEFRGTELNKDNWTCEIGTGDNGWGNEELQYYTDRKENVKVKNGFLVITARKEDYNGSPWTSARIITKGKKEFSKGIITARMKMPVGAGTWPAFWTLGGNIDEVSWPKCGEIDIMEHVNSENRVHGTVHWLDESRNGQADWGCPSNENHWTTFNVDVTEWHEYTIEWTEKTIKWYVDGQQFMEMSMSPEALAEEFVNMNHFILFNLAMGGRWPGNPNATTKDTNTMLVDFVRVYENK